MKIKSKVLIFFSSILMVVQSGMVCAETEKPDATYTGVDNARTTIRNIDFIDLKNRNIWSKDAIYTTAALDIMKGYGNRNFGREDILTKAQGIALAYRAAGREADAIKAAELLDAQRLAEEKKKDALRMWADGYLQLAQTDGLITAQDFQDSQVSDRSELTEESFNPDSPLRREDFAYYISKVLKLNPVYPQQAIFNQFTDWQKADPLRVPYIEALLQNKIMNGDGQGSFYPKGNVTREQAAQVMKNSIPNFMTQNNMIKKVGTIEDILMQKSNGTTGDNYQKTFAIRNEKGGLDYIQIVRNIDNTNTYRNERLSNALGNSEKDFPAYIGNTIGDSNLLNIGNSIEYIVDSNNNVKFVNGISEKIELNKYLAKVDGVDLTNNKITFSRLLNITNDNTEMSIIGRRFEQDAGIIPETFVFSKAAKLYLLNKKSELKNVIRDTILQIDVVNGIVNMMQEMRFDTTGYKSNVVYGVVDENNPSLGFVSLFNTNGTGVYENISDRAKLLRTYNYDQYQVVVQKDGINSKIGNVVPGDRIFIKLNPNETVAEISAASDLVPYYGKVLRFKNGNLSIEFDDGTQKIFKISNKTPVFSNEQPIDIKNIRDGDRIRVLLSEGSPESQRIREIRVEEGNYLITNIYKGIYDNYSKDNDTISFTDTHRLERSNWNRLDYKGIFSLKIDKDQVFQENKGISSIEELNESYIGHLAYLATIIDISGNEKVVFLSFQNSKDSETKVMKDNLVVYSSGSGEIGLSNEYKNLKYDSGSLIVKNGRIVKPVSIENEDQAYVVGRKSFETNEYYAGIVKIEDRPLLNVPRIYRGRIQSINEGKDFSVQSYSVFNGSKWEFVNTPKIFQINTDTRLVNSTGVQNMDGFVGYGTKTYVDQTAYIFTDGDNVLEINSTAFGDYVLRGEIYDLARNGNEKPDETGKRGNISMIKLRNVKNFNSTTGVWRSIENIDLDINTQGVIIYRGKMIVSGELQKGDIVKAIKKTGDTEKEALIIFIEN